MGEYSTERGVCMANQRTRRRTLDEAAIDLRLQEKIFLITFGLMILFLVTLYVSVPVFIPGVIALVLLAETGYFYKKHHDFYKLRDRGQRTWCVTISMYISLLLTLLCAYYFSRDGVLEWDYALVFLFGFMFFTYMVYRTLSPSIVIGNIRQRIRK